MIGKGILALAAAAILGGGAYVLLTDDAQPEPLPGLEPAAACDSCDARHQNLERLREERDQSGTNGN